MKQSNKGFDYSYNAQAVVDSAEQIIVAAETTNEANDKQQAVPMAKAALDNLNAAGIEQPKAADGTPTPIPNTADTGYFSKEAVEELEKTGHRPAHRHRSTEAPRSTGSGRGGSALRRSGSTLGRSECEGKDAEQTAYGDW